MGGRNLVRLGEQHQGFNAAAVVLVNSTVDKEFKVRDMHIQLKNKLNIVADVICFSEMVL